MVIKIYRNKIIMFFFFIIKSQISSNYRVCMIKVNRTKTNNFVFFKKAKKVVVWSYESPAGFHCCQLENEFLTLILLAKEFL